MNSSVPFTSIEIAWIAILAIALALIVVIIYHAVVVRRALRRLHEATPERRDEPRPDGTSVAQLNEITRRTSALEALARTDVSRIGFVRYAAFDDTGSDLSYALALLNREGDGVVLSSIYSREDSRTFGKAVAKFTPVSNASKEELQAIEQAKATPR